MYSALVLIVFLLMGATFGKISPPSKISFPTGDIINGQEAEPHSAPYIVSLKTDSHFCAGSIISETAILTAGHCLIYSKFLVVAGLHNRLNETGTITRQASLSHSIQHPGYGGGVGPYDIGLIKIDPPFEFNTNVNKIQLPLANQRHYGEATLFGWGKVKSGFLPINLQTVNTMIIEYSKCKKQLPYGAPIHPTNICSNSNKDNESGISACNGDSGGPLIQYVDEGKAQLVGIVSWGYIPCGIDNKPSVYTHTSAHIEWIERNTNLL